MVCPCVRVSQEDIERAIEDGASNFKDVKKKTKIVTKCGKCKNRAKCLVRELFAEKDLIIEKEEGVCLGCQGDFFEPVEEAKGQEKILTENASSKKALKEKASKEKYSKEKTSKEKKEKKSQEDKKEKKHKKEKKEKKEKKVKKDKKDKKEKKQKEKAEKKKG